MWKAVGLLDGTIVTKAEILTFASAAGVGEDGLVSLEQFRSIVAAAKTVTAGEASTELKALFDILDARGTGEVAASEVLHVLQTLAEPLSAKDGRALLRERGLADTATLSFPQFVDFLTPR